MPLTLVVDNDPAFIAQCEILSSQEKGQTRHRYVFAHSNEQAIKLLRAMDDLDVAIVAVDNKSLSGLELFRSLAGKNVRIPRIALTDADDLPLIRRAMNDGAADFLTRPVSLEDLQHTIDRVYAECERRRQAWKTQTQLSAIRREVDIASDVQKRILPINFPEDKGLEFAVRIKPAKEMTGDFYDVFEISPNRLGIVIADVTGKGIPAAFFMAVARTLIQATAIHNASPADCLRQTNDLLCRHDVAGMFVSVFYGVLDMNSWSFTYANGGHLPPYVKRHGNRSIELLDGGRGVILGVESNLDYAQKETSLAAGDILFLYTDGLTEAFDESHVQFGEERLRRILSSSNGGSAESLCTSVWNEIEVFKGTADLSDDFTCLAVKRARVSSYRGDAAQLTTQ